MNKKVYAIIQVVLFLLVGVVVYFGCSIDSTIGKFLIIGLGLIGLVALEVFATNKLDK